MTLSYRLNYDSALTFSINDLKISTHVGLSIDFCNVYFSFENNTTVFGAITLSVASLEFCESCSNRYPTNCFIAHGYRFRVQRFEFNILLTIETI